MDGAREGVILFTQRQTKGDRSVVIADVGTVNMPNVVVETIGTTVQGVFTLVLFQLEILTEDLELAMSDPAGNPTDQPVGAEAVVGKFVQVF